MEISDKSLNKNELTLLRDPKFAQKVIEYFDEPEKKERVKALIASIREAHLTDLNCYPIYKETYSESWLLKIDTKCSNSPISLNDDREIQDKVKEIIKWIEGDTK